MLEELAHHVLDIAENGINAGADRIFIEVDDGSEEIRITVGDNGRGMDEETVRAVTDPFYTTRKERRVGLGLPFLKQLAELCGGTFSLNSRPGEGSQVIASFRKDSIDTPPLGDMASSILALLVGHSAISWRYLHRHRGREFLLESEDLLDALGGKDSLSDPGNAMMAREYLEGNILDLYL